MKHVKNFSIIIIGLVIGVALLKVMGSSRAPVGHAAQEETAAAAFYIDMEPTSFNPFVIAYGEVEHSDEITVSSEVSGRVLYVHPGLKEGQILSAGTVVVRLDQTSIKLDLIQAQADLKAQEASRAQTLLEEKNLQATLESSRERLILQEQEYDRMANLARTGNVSTSDLDTQRQTILSTQSEVNSAELNLALVPLNLEMADAQIENLESIVEQKQIDLANTVITMQQSWRVSDVSISEGAYVATGTALFTTSSPNDYEVEAKISSNQFINVFGPNTDFAQTSATIHPMSSRAITLPGQPIRASEGLSSTTRMMGVVVDFKVPVELSVKGLYTEVVIKGPQQSLWVIPRSAIHQGNIYLISDDNTLITEPVNVRFYQEDYAVLADKPSGTRLILSNLSPAVIGMKIDGTLDDNAVSMMTETLNSK